MKCPTVKLPLRGFCDTREFFQWKTIIHPTVLGPTGVLTSIRSQVVRIKLTISLTDNLTFIAERSLALYRRIIVAQQTLFERFMRGMCSKALWRGRDNDRAD
ncbi:hypothetical protein ACMFWY_08325 [Roseiconus sp. JC912]|uniref:hypothetical protein n=1 Tax=Roseiconus sp. JC912 TaxID=3396307 RepID=UPI003A4C77CA